MNKDQYAAEVEQQLENFLLSGSGNWKPKLKPHHKKLIESDPFPERSAAFHIGFVLGLAGSEWQPYLLPQFGERFRKVFSDALDFGRFEGKIADANGSLPDYPELCRWCGVHLSDCQCEGFKESW